MKQVEIDGKMYELKPIKAKKSKGNFGLAWWTKGHDFKVTQDNLKYVAKNGKTYKAVKGIDKNGKELVLKAIYGGSRWTKDDF